MYSDDIAIRVTDLSKRFEIYGVPRDRLRQFILPPLQSLAGKQPKQYFREFWALRDVSFEIKKGETVGIIGRNGSGKSTLLQIICGTLTPTCGNIEINGRVAALLELGSGFNPEFTGRENIYMNAAVLGLSQDEIASRFNEIVNFADIGQFIDQPVKTYSSGMLVRLAFSVAINVEPEILIIDEALSVGDELFQRKCFSRLETIRAAGATVLFVSHSGAQIVELCDRAVLMDSGERLAIGPPKHIVGRYQKLLYSPEQEKEKVRIQIRREASQHPTFATQADVMEALPALGSIQGLHEIFDPHLTPSRSLDFDFHDVVIHLPRILTLSGNHVNGLLRGKKYKCRYRVDFSRSATTVRFGISIKTTTGLTLGGALSAPSLSEAIALIQEGNSVEIEFAFSCNLNPGLYFMNVGVFGCQGNEETVLNRMVDAVAFRVLPIQNNIETEAVNFCFEPCMNFL